MLRILFLLVALFGVGAAPALAADKFDRWVKGVRKEALRKGVSAGTFDTAFKGVRPNPKVIKLDRRQPESRLTFQRYMELVVPESRVKMGRRMYLENRELLEEIAAKYGVQARFIVAFWGVESDFGRRMGNFSIIRSLATLAYDGRRSKYFRAELINALKILEQGHISNDKMKGSWAGAMGQSQFMPSSFLSRAVDHNGDGRRDIWTTRADVFASAANYLKKAGWRNDMTWGRQVRVPKNFSRNLASHDIRKRMKSWQALGVRLPDGGNLPTRQLQASVVLPERGKLTPAYLVYHNYRVILRWNRSNYFALAIGHLADRIAQVKS